MRFIVVAWRERQGTGGVTAVMNEDTSGYQEGQRVRHPALLGGGSIHVGFWGSFV